MYLDMHGLIFETSHAFTVCIRTENQNQVSSCPFTLREVSAFNMEIFAQPHGLPGLLHCYWYAMFLENVYENNSRCYYIFIGRCSTPVQNDALYWSNVLTHESKSRTHLEDFYVLVRGLTKTTDLYP